MERMLLKAQCEPSSLSPSVQLLVNEIKEDYLFSVKTAISIYFTKPRIFADWMICNSKDSCKKNIVCFNTFLFAISVDYTFRYAGENDKDKVEELSPERLE